MTRLASWAKSTLGEISEEPVWRQGIVGWRESCTTMRLRKQGKAVAVVVAQYR